MTLAKPRVVRAARFRSASGKLRPAEPERLAGGTPTGKAPPRAEHVRAC